MSYSSQRSWSKLPQPAIVGCTLTAFQPLCQIAREPSIEKKPVSFGVGTSSLSNVERKLTPSSGTCGKPLTTSGSSTPRQSYIVGTTSVACRNWCRSSPLASMPFGQEMTIGSATPPSKL